MADRVELKGQKFDRLTVIEFSHSDRNGHAFWLCKCSCGKMTKVESSSLRSGRTRSCGCLRRDISEERRSTLRQRKADDAKTCKSGYKQSICGECRNYICSWLQEHVPVDGWDAVRNDIYVGRKLAESYFVRSCPEYKG